MKMVLLLAALALVMPAVDLDPTVIAKLSTERITLHDKLKADMAYSLICERAGIGVTFDPSFHPQEIWIHFNGTLRQALELIAHASHTTWHPITPQMIAVDIK